MEDVKGRLQENTKICVEIYEQWSKDAKNVDLRRQMEEAVHELRKVASRIEIELAIADRSNSNMKPMPIPPHRASQPKGGKRNNGNKAGQQGQDNGGNGDDKPKKPRRTKLKNVSGKDDGGSE